MIRDKKLELWETFGSVLWFLLDGSWMLDWRMMVTVLIVPTILCNFLTLFYLEKSDGSVLSGITVNSWLLMNVFWILGDMYHVGFAPLWAKITFWSGVGILLIGLIMHKSYKHYIFLVFHRFRRFKLHKNTVDNKVQ